MGENGDEPLQPVVSGGNSELEGGNENGTMSVGACSSAVYGAMAWPFEKLFELTCPECHYQGDQAYLYPVTFVMSLVWVSLFSFIISAIVPRWVKLTGLGSGLFGLIVISMGAEIPDTIQSMSVARRG